MTVRSESQRLDSIARRAPHTQGVMVSATEYCWSIFKRYIRGTSVLELGPAEGVMTQLMISAGFEVTCVEGSPTAAADLKRRLPSAKVVSNLFEEYEPEAQFDCIIMGHVLEHVASADLLLTRVRDWLTGPDSVLLVSVPNANSLHRQAAVAMGLLSSVTDLNESDIAHGHERVFRYGEVYDLLSVHGFTVHEQGGYWLKTLANHQIERWYTDDMVHAFMALGESYPEIAAETYLVATYALA